MFNIGNKQQRRVRTSSIGDSLTQQKHSTPVGTPLGKTNGTPTSTSKSTTALSSRSREELRIEDFRSSPKSVTSGYKSGVSPTPSRPFERTSWDRTPPTPKRREPQPASGGVQTWTYKPPTVEDIKPLDRSPGLTQAKVTPPSPAYSDRPFPSRAATLSRIDERAEKKRREQLFQPSPSTLDRSAASSRLSYDTYKSTTTGPTTPSPRLVSITTKTLPTRQQEQKQITPMSGRQSRQSRESTLDSTSSSSVSSDSDSMVDEYEKDEVERGSVGLQEAYKGQEFLGQQRTTPISPPMVGVRGTTPTKYTPSFATPYAAKLAERGAAAERVTARVTESTRPEIGTRTTAEPPRSTTSVRDAISAARSSFFSGEKPTPPPSKPKFTPYSPSLLTSTTSPTTTTPTFTTTSPYLTSKTATTTATTTTTPPTATTRPWVGYRSTSPLQKISLDEKPSTIGGDRRSFGAGLGTDRSFDRSFDRTFDRSPDASRIEDRSYTGSLPRFTHMSRKRVVKNADGSVEEVEEVLHPSGERPSLTQKPVIVGATPTMRDYKSSITDKSYTPYSPVCFLFLIVFFLITIACTMLSVFVLNSCLACLSLSNTILNQWFNITSICVLMMMMN